MDLGFRSGDAVVNTYPDGSRPDESEVALVCEIRRDGDGHLWWAWDDRDLSLCIVSCGKSWVLHTARAVLRDDKVYSWQDGQWVELSYR